jgi:ATP-dependent Lon protease
MDRMEIIRLHGYTEQEKYNIAKNFLIPKQIKFNGLSEKKVKFSKNAIMTIIRRYTREAGVRNLERKFSAICRKIAKQIVKKEKVSLNIGADSVKKYLGVYRFRHGEIEKEDKIGMCTGLAWTRAGGEILCIETLVMPGKGEILMTGKLGDVMKESARAAISYVRSKAKELGIDENFHKKFDIHIHVPEGAIPKDGPSAGIAMCTSIISALSKKPIYKDVAMTGEITLRGSVIPIGGLKEKILAALRGGIKKILIPKENEKDLAEISKKILSKLDIVPIEYMDEVIEHSLLAS